MKILSPDDVQAASAGVVFRQSVWPALAGTVALWLTALMVGVAGISEVIPRWLGLLASGFLIAFGAIAASSLRRALRSSNWLVRVSGDRVLINLRSYLNTGFPDVPHVVELSRDDIRGVGSARLRLDGEDRSGALVSETMLFLDLHLAPSVDAAPLESCLRRERALRWRGAAWRHYPVILIDESTVRVEWRSRHSRVVPPVRQAVELLGNAVDEVQERLDLGRAADNTGTADAARQLQQLAHQGRILEATLLAERQFGCTTAEARRLVEELASRGRLGKS